MEQANLPPVKWLAITQIPLASEAQLKEPALSHFLALFLAQAIEWNGPCQRAQKSSKREMCLQKGQLHININNNLPLAKAFAGHLNESVRNVRQLTGKL